MLLVLLLGCSKWLLVLLLRVRSVMSRIRGGIHGPFVDAPGETVAFLAFVMSGRAQQCSRA